MSSPNDKASEEAAKAIQNISVGSLFKGKSRGTINYTGTNHVDEIVGGQTVNVGSSFDGEQEAQSVINYGETNTVKNILVNDNVEENMESTDPTTSKLEKYKVENEATEATGFRIHGHVTIINQEFRGAKGFRAGSIQDVKNLKGTFSGRFGIEPNVKPDLKYEDIVKVVDVLSQTDFSAYKLFVFIYMSHGDAKGIVAAADHDFSLKKTIIDPIMGNKSLNGIVKIFITVACRGDKKYEECDINIEEFDGHTLSTATGIDYSKRMISYSTYEGHVSKRSPGTGTYFIKYLCEFINEDNGDTKIHSLFAKVNDKLSEMKKQVSVFNTSMGDVCFKDLASTQN